MIRSILNLFWKPKPIDLIKFHVLDKFAQRWEDEDPIFSEVA